MMKKLTALLLTLFLMFNVVSVKAFEITILDPNQTVDEEVTREEVFNYFGDSFDEKLPETYKYINLNFKGLNKDSDIYRSLQKLVYLDLIGNTDTYFFKNKNLQAYSFYKLAEKFYGVELIDEDDIETLKSRATLDSDFRVLKNSLSNSYYDFEFNTNSRELSQKKLIFSDVYKTIKSQHYNNDEIDDVELIDSAIEGLAKGAGDKYTAYFPPVKNKIFNESLSGEYEGIGAYVDMENPGELTIVSPIVGSPAAEAGLKGGDIVTHVDGVKIEKNNSVEEVVSWIKGPAGTKVVLTIKRGKQVLEIEVTRGNIVIKDIEYEVIDRNTFYLKLKFFGPNTFNDFTDALTSLKEERNISKIIIDLRNNPGGYLDQVTNMLSYFVPEDEPTAVVKYRTSSISYNSKGYDLIDFSKYNIVILQNSGSASASEIMIGTIKDYYPDVTLVGENTYGKGSVQTIKSYKDGGSLKYTVAKWFTGKTETGIDGIGIAPDIEVLNEHSENNDDLQLEEAKKIR